MFVYKCGCMIYHTSKANINTLIFLYFKANSAICDFHILQLFLLIFEYCTVVLDGASWAVVVANLEADARTKPDSCTSFIYLFILIV